MSDEVDQLMAGYWTWLKSKTKIKEVGNWSEITTPYLDRHNDRIQIYAKVDAEGRIHLTDDGYTINDLKLSGCELTTQHRRNLLEQTLNGFGVAKDQRDALSVQATVHDFARKKHRLIQAMLAVNDMFCLASSYVTSLFYEDVLGWLKEKDIRFTSHAKFTGKSGYDHMFDFVIPSSRQAPERFVQTINKPNKDNAQSVAFAWIDTRDVRDPSSQAYAFLNDMDAGPQPAVLEALRTYGVTPISWSQRENNLTVLAS